VNEYRCFVTFFCEPRSRLGFSERSPRSQLGFSERSPKGRPMFPERSPWSRPGFMNEFFRIISLEVCRHFSGIHIRYKFNERLRELCAKTRALKAPCLCGSSLVVRSGGYAPCLARFVQQAFLHTKYAMRCEHFIKCYFSGGIETRTEVSVYPRL
jgi:hypothetical protein